MKWAAGVLLVIVVCFCLGYFVLGPSSRFGQRTAASVNGGDGATVIERSVLPSPGSGIEVKDRTREIEAARRKAEEERKKRAEEEKKKREEEEEKKKREEEARRKREEEEKRKREEEEKKKRPPLDEDDLRNY
jgi:membrane protein involved in colicin uptake